MIEKITISLFQKKKKKKIFQLVHQFIYQKVKIMITQRKKNISIQQDKSNSHKKTSITKKKKRGKYRKKENKTEFENNIQYIEINEEKNGINFLWKYSLSKYHANTNTGYYYCSDTNCNGTGYNIFKIDDNKNLTELLKEDKFNISNQHSIPYEDHSYVIDKSIINDYNNLNKNEIVK